MFKKLQWLVVMPVLAWMLRLALHEEISKYIMGEHTKVYINNLLHEYELQRSEGG